MRQSAQNTERWERQMEQGGPSLMETLIGQDSIDELKYTTGLAGAVFGLPIAFRTLGGVLAPAPPPIPQVVELGYLGRPF